MLAIFDGKYFVVVYSRDPAKSVHFDFLQSNYLKFSQVYNEGY
jgi:hypothetical protein